MGWCTLLSNTPLHEVIDSSPISDKIVYLVNIFPHYQKLLPQDMFEAWHRARDIIYTDKTDNNIRLSTIMSRHLSLLKEMHDLLMISCARFKEKGNDADFEDRFDKMELEYNKLAHRRGAIIKDIVRIERPEKTHPSRRNTITGKLTWSMWVDVFKRARSLIVNK